MTRTEARISINKLGEYLVARPNRRLTIIRDQKEPSDFIVAYYPEAEDAITESIIHNHPPDFLEEKIVAMRDKPRSTNWDKTRQSVCIEALEYFISFIDQADFSSYGRHKGNNSPRKISIGEVAISVRPEVILTDDKNEVVGAIKLIFSKSRSAAEEEAQYIAALLHHYVKEVHNPACAHKNCYVIDVFAGNIHSAPRAFRRRMEDIKAACSEISDTWRRA